jgi:Bacteriophage baseplate protein W
MSERLDRRMSTAADPARAFLGVGWAFPPGFDGEGHIAEAAYEQDVQQAILIILGTNHGERVMRPDFGAGLDRLVFEPINAATLARAESLAREAIIAWEPRVDVEAVRVTQQGRPPAVLLIELGYRVRATNTRQNLVYPFYLQEGSSE